VRRALLALLLALLLVLPACGSGTDDTSSGGTDPAAVPLTVFAAASLTESFTELGRGFEASHPGAEVTFSFAGSPSLVAQLQAGAPADVVVTADERSTVSLAAELDGEPVVLARNRLAIVTEPGDPKRLTTLAALAGPGVKVVLAQQSVPAGKAARAALTAAGVTVKAVSEEPDVKAVVSKVRLGEADAGIAYVTDLRAAGAAVSGTELPGGTNAYPGGVLEQAAQPVAARTFLEYVAGPDGRAVLERFGFLPP
jgi:molybdate transport system substrate-binding protein